MAECSGEVAPAAIVAFSEIVRGVFQNAYIGWRTHPTVLRQGCGTEAERLAQLVLQGQKTATCEALQHYRAAGVRLPTVGGLSIVLDGNQQPVAVIETIEVALRPFEEVEERFAFDEGEGDRTLTHWRESHERYFRRTLPAVGAEFEPRLPLVCERFRVVWPRDGARRG